MIWASQQLFEGMDSGLAFINNTDSKRIYLENVFDIKYNYKLYNSCYFLEMNLL